MSLSIYLRRRKSTEYLRTNTTFSIDRLGKIIESVEQDLRVYIIIYHSDRIPCGNDRQTDLSRRND